MPAASNEPGEELAVDPWTLSHYCLSHAALTPTDGSKLLQTRRERTDVRMKSPHAVSASVEPLQRCFFLLTHSRAFLRAELCLVASVAQI